MAADEDKRERAIERILAAAATGPATPEGPCLDDGEIIEYALELMEESARARAARHVETCPPCVDEVIQIVEERRYWERHIEERDRVPSFLPARGVEPAVDDASKAAPPRGRPPRRR